MSQAARRENRHIVSPRYAVCGKQFRLHYRFTFPGGWGILPRLFSKTSVTVRVTKWNKEFLSPQPFFSPFRASVWGETTTSTIRKPGNRKRPGNSSPLKQGPPKKAAGRSRIWRQASRNSPTIMSGTSRRTPCTVPPPKPRSWEHWTGPGRPGPGRRQHDPRGQEGRVTRIRERRQLRDRGGTKRFRRRRKDQAFQVLIRRQSPK